MPAWDGWRRSKICDGRSERALPIFWAWISTAPDAWGSSVSGRRHSWERLGFGPRSAPHRAQIRSPQKITAGGFSGSGAGAGRGIEMTGERALSP
jgi:hypothetical protein